MSENDLDQLQEYKQAVENLVAAIRAEEALATADHSEKPPWRSATPQTSRSRKR